MHPDEKAAGDGIWDRIVAEARELARTEYALATRLFADVLDQHDFASALAYQLEKQLSDRANARFSRAALEAFQASPGIVEAARCDLQGVMARDPAEGSPLSVLQ